METDSFRSIKLFSSKESIKDVDKIDKKEKVACVNIIDEIDEVKKTTERILQKETPTSTFGRKISDNVMLFNKATVMLIK